MVIRKKMIIKTNKSSSEKVHNLIEHEPIERQIFDYIKSRDNNHTAKSVIIDSSLYIQVGYFKLWIDTKKNNVFVSIDEMELYGDYMEEGKHNSGNIGDFNHKYGLKYNVDISKKFDDVLSKIEHNNKIIDLIVEHGKRYEEHINVIEEEVKAYLNEPLKKTKWEIPARGAFDNLLDIVTNENCKRVNAKLSFYITYKGKAPADVIYLGFDEYVNKLVVFWSTDDMFNKLGGRYAKDVAAANAYIIDCNFVQNYMDTINLMQCPAYAEYSKWCDEAIELHKQLKKF